MYTVMHLPSYPRSAMAAIGFVVLACAAALPPVYQDPLYHRFADQRTLHGIPHFWNVVSNIALLLPALWGLRAFASLAYADRRVRILYGALLAGLALVAAGSTYYHLNPDDATLFWDRLPMALSFMTLLAFLAADHIDSATGWRWWAPLLIISVGSMWWWQATGDLRPYGVVQFGSIAAVVALTVRFPARHTDSWGVWWMIALYAVAKVFELADGSAALAPYGGHAWKHVFAGLGLLGFVESLAARRRVATAGGVA